MDPPKPLLGSRFPIAGGHFCFKFKPAKFCNWVHGKWPNLKGFFRPSTRCWGLSPQNSKGAIQKSSLFCTHFGIALKKTYPTIAFDKNQKKRVWFGRFVICFKKEIRLKVAMVYFLHRKFKYINTLLAYIKFKRLGNFVYENGFSANCPSPPKISMILDGGKLQFLFRIFFLI